MTCDAVSKLIPLRFYGELPLEEENRLEAHLRQCAACAREMDRMASLAGALDGRTAEPPEFLLEECRADLKAAMQGAAPLAAPRVKGPWRLFLEAMGASLAGFSRWRAPVGAVALVAIGFVGARFSGAGRTWWKPSEDAAAFATVRSVQADNAGRVQIAFDETRRRTISGRTDSPDIQKLLLTAFHQNNPDVRVESMGLLSPQSDTAEVRDALLGALDHDPNAGVRLKALDKLKPLAADPEVRKTMARILETDDNAGVRMQVVDLLALRPDESMVGVLQSAVQREDNSGVRQKLEKTLKDMNASVGTF